MDACEDEFDTLLVEAGRAKLDRPTSVNPPVFHASSVLFGSMAEFEAAEAKPYDSLFYGRLGTPTTFALEEAIAALEGGHRSVATASGLAAIAASMIAFVGAGDHMLVVDSVYGPARRFCERRLRRMGVEITYYDPRIASGISELIRPNTKAVYVESPGSLTLEIQDVPAIAHAAHRAGAVVVMDNTWASPIFFRGFEHGADVVIQSGTKYISGHSDAMIGMITATADTYQAVRTASQDLGACAGSEECYLALRGMRTLSLRMQRHQESALQVAQFLASRPEVEDVLYPALPGTPDYALWARDFKGASGLLSFVLKECSTGALHRMVDHLEHFSIGFSWGGFESQVLPVHPESSRTVTKWLRAGPTIRLHVGLEAVGDLIADLSAGLDRLAAST